MKKFTLEQNTRKERLSTVFLTVLIILVAVLAVTRVIIANRLVEDSEKLRTMDLEIAQIQDNNQTLAEELRGPQSITQIAQKAKAQGFVPTKNLVFLTKIPEVALETNLSSALR